MGWDVGVATMKVGERAILTIKPDWGYGSNEAGPIPANSVLIFDVQLLSWKDPTLLESITSLPWFLIFSFFMCAYYLAKNYM